MTIIGDHIALVQAAIVHGLPTAIQPESGSSSIKVSAFPSAAGTGMASADRVTGLQSGANVNWTQTQLLHGKDAVASSGLAGADLHIVPGAGDGPGAGGFLTTYAAPGGVTGRGGNFAAAGGPGGATSGNGGGSYLSGGNAVTGNGGPIYCFAGGTANGHGGNMALYGGPSSAGDAGYVKMFGGQSTNGNGGYIKISGGPGSGGSNHGGNLTLQPGSATGGAALGWLYLGNVPRQADDSGVPSGAAWINSGTGALSIAP